VSDEPTILPVVQGDWVARSGSGSFEVARVRQSYFEDGMVYADLVPYNLDGENLKRVSPVEGGPKSFEPWCQITDNGWQRIERPEFPLLRKAVGIPDPDKPGWNRLQVTLFHEGRGSVKPKAPRTKRRKQSSDYPRDRVRVLQIPGQPSNKAEMEIAALRRSAQEFRDEARRSGRIVGEQAVEFMRKRADALEAEAARIEGAR
jgi:hypothetical protein